MRRPQESGLFNTGDVTDITGSLYSGDDDNAVLSSNADITDNTDRLLYGNSKSRTFNALRTQLAQSERKLNMSGDSATNSTHKPRPRRSSSPRIVDKREKRHTSGTRSFTGSDSDESSNVLTDEGLTDLNNVATLLEQYATAGWPNSETGVGVSFDYMNMATAIINQSEFNFESGVGRVGTVIKGMSDWKAENGSSATGLVGFVSMVNLIRYKNTLWARQLREYFLAATEGIQDADLKSHNLGGRLRLKRALNSDRALLLILESALEAVCEEVDYAREDETDGQIKRFWNYDTIIYLTHAKSTYKKAVNARKKRRHADRKAEKNHGSLFRETVRRRNSQCAFSEHTEDGSGGIGEGDLGQPTALGCVGPADIYHSFPEERCLHSASIFSSIFQTKQQKEQAEGEVRLLLVLTREGLSKARAEMRKISEEEDKKAQERVRARADRAATGQPRTPRRNLKIPCTSVRNIKISGVKGARRPRPKPSVERGQSGSRSMEQKKGDKRDLDISKPPAWLTKSNKKKRLTFHKEYKGRYHVGNEQVEYLEIKSEEEYKSFVATIPKKKMIPSNCKLDSFTPREIMRVVLDLLSTYGNPQCEYIGFCLKNSIDFEKKMMLVALRSDSMYKHPVIESVCQTRTETRRFQSGWTPWSTAVTYRHPDLGDTMMYSAPDGVGSYHAVVVDRLSFSLSKNSKSPFSTSEVRWSNLSAPSRNDEEGKNQGPRAFQQAPKSRMIQQAGPQLQMAPQMQQVPQVQQQLEQLQLKPQQEQIAPQQLQENPFE
eukprot:jgi/Bigna1/90436/estExt_fgenesh1_pg.C_700072